MTNFIMTSLYGLFCVGIGYALGYSHRDMNEKIKELYKKIKAEEEASLGVTPGNYGPVSELNHVNQAGSVGLVEAKTPQRVEWDMTQELEREVREAGHK